MPTTAAHLVDAAPAGSVRRVLLDAAAVRSGHLLSLYRAFSRASSMLTLLGFCRGGNAPGHRTVDALEEAGIEQPRSYRKKPSAQEN